MKKNPGTIAMMTAHRVERAFGARGHCPASAPPGTPRTRAPRRPNRPEAQPPPTPPGPARMGHPQAGAANPSGLTDTQKGGMAMDLTNILELQGEEIVAEGVELPASTGSSTC